MKHMKTIKVRAKAVIAFLQELHGKREKLFYDAFNHAFSQAYLRQI